MRTRAQPLPSRARWSLSRARHPAGILALLLAVAAFGLYATTAGQLVGYEPETAAVTAGLVDHGVLQVLPATPLTNQGLRGTGGHLYSRTGLAQPLLEAPFYFLGEKLDDTASGGHSYSWRLALLRFYNPAMAVLTVLAAFGLLRLRGRSCRRALGVAALCAVGSLVWPYSKIGMDTTLMATVALALLAAAWAAARAGPGRFALAGLAAGVAVTTKPYGLLLLVGVIPLVAPAVRSLRTRDRLRVLAAFAGPTMVGIASVGWYNAYRTGSITDFLHSNPTDVLHTPVNVLGLLVSPGKGLVFYSPLVVLGVLGLRELWREDRQFGLAIVLTVAVNTLIIGATWVWSDDTWGPRYLVPTVWLLLLPIAYWAEGRRRRRAVGWVAAVAVFVQTVGVFAPYDASTVAARSLSGVYVYPIGLTPQTARGKSLAYGNDGPRWIPEVSPVLLQSEVLTAWIKEGITGSGFTVTYNPTWGIRRQLDLRHPGASLGVVLPDFWWTFPGQSSARDIFAALIAAVGLGAGAAAARLVRPRRPGSRAGPQPARPATSA